MSMTMEVSTVDDDPMWRGFITFGLKRYEDICCASSHRSGEEALRCLPQVQPDVVLMDIRMPGMGGQECTQKLVALLPRVSVIIISGFLDADTLSTAMRAGACGYLEKPSSIEACAQAIRDAMNGWAPVCAKAAKLLVEWFQKANQTGGADSGLTAREKEVLELCRKGVTTDKESAAAL